MENDTSKTTDRHRLRLRLDIAAEPELMIAEKDDLSLSEALAHISEFLVKFGHPDRGRQTIEIRLESVRAII